MKFAGQIFEVTTRLPAEPLTEDGKTVLRERFIQDYEAEFGTGTAWTEAEILFINSRVRAVSRTDPQKIVTMAGGAASHESYRRPIVDPASGRTVTVDVHRGFSALGRANGPCVIEEPDTTVFVPGGASVELVEGGHFLLRLASATSS